MTWRPIALLVAGLLLVLATSIGLVAAQPVGSNFGDQGGERLLSGALARLGADCFRHEVNSPAPEKQRIRYREPRCDSRIEQVRNVDGILGTRKAARSHQCILVLNVLSS
jgi:hypothetical protein